MKRRDLMAPDTEPTDEELEEVMRAARDEAVRRRDRMRAAFQARIEAAVRDAVERSPDERAAH